MRVKVQRKVEVWVEEIYDIDNINPETIQNLIDYEEEWKDINVLWETQEDTGQIEVFDEDYNLIDQRGMDSVYE